MSKVFAWHVSSGTSFDIDIEQKIGRRHVIDGAQHLIFSTIGRELGVAQLTCKRSLNVEGVTAVRVDAEVGSLAITVRNFWMYLDGPTALQEACMKEQFECRRRKLDV
ncbi:hypothetical protein AXG89_20670 [Burkholderia sp. PAMC 26561]|nr:hypothetical protein AXG89_20670 [Burkholderia sp. PAMC 26561]